MNPLERLLNLVALLLEAPRPLTFEQIRELLPAYGQQDRTTAKRQFERDKDLLRTIGVPVELGSTDAWQVEEGYGIDKDRYYLPEISFTPEEVAALFVAATAPGEDREAAQAFRKLVQGADASVLAGLGEMPEPSGVDPSAPHLRPVAEAVAGRQRVRFRYRPAQGRAARREVDAWGLVYRGGSWYLVGGDRKRHEPRAFRLSRFLSEVAAVGPGDPPPQGFRAADHVQAGPWGVGEPESTARVAFSPKVAWWALAGIAGSKTVGTGPDGWIEAEVPAGPGDAFVSWVLSFGADAVLRSPETLRRKVVERLEAIRVSV